MVVKLLRLGFTEFTLLVVYYLEKHNIPINFYIPYKINKINWLYTTSGYYDKTQKSSYMNVKHRNGDPPIYNEYFETLLNFIKDSDNFTYYSHFDTANNDVKNQVKNLLHFINPKNNYNITPDKVYEFIANKRVLIISPFAPLFKQQIESGNCKQIDPNFPKMEKTIYYRNIYTFFNSGPHANILETAKHIVDEVNALGEDFDSVLISAGAYGCILAKAFYDQNKNVCVVGGDLQKMFGILNTREKETMARNRIDINKLPNKHCWILNIPDEYKPLNYKKIENGCYW